MLENGILIKPEEIHSFRKLRQINNHFVVSNFAANHFNNENNIVNYTAEFVDRIYRHFRCRAQFLWRNSTEINAFVEN